MTIGLDDKLEKKLRAAAKQEGISVSRLASRWVEEGTAETWPEKVPQLAGAWNDLERPKTGEDFHDLGV